MYPEARIMYLPSVPSRLITCYVFNGHRWEWYSSKILMARALGDVSAQGFLTPPRGVLGLRHCAPVATRSRRVAQSGALGLMVW